jgi:hypothetical protein
VLSFSQAAFLSLIIAAVRAQGGLSQLSAINRHNRQLFDLLVGAEQSFGQPWSRGLDVADPPLYREYTKLAEGNLLRVRPGLRTVPAVYRFTLPSSLLKRGFWIYVWKIRIREGRPKFYVGMTGDTGSYSAQSPLNRVSAHLGHNERSNHLRRYLQSHGIDIECCEALDFAAYGPMGNVPSDEAEYRVARAKIAAVEKRLWEHMACKGLDMLNRCPSCRTAHDPQIFERVRAQLEPFFDT